MTNNNLDPFFYHLWKCGVDSFKKLERRQIHGCWPHDDEEDEINEIEDVILVEVGEALIETNYCNGTFEVVNIFLKKSVLYVVKEVVFMLLDNAVFSVFVKTVIKIKVILIY